MLKNINITFTPYLFIKMQKLAERINKLEESATIKMAGLSRELKAKGIDVIDLSLGEPDFGTPEHIKNAAKQAIDAGFSHYTPVPGYLDLREAISLKFKRDNGLDYGVDQIITSTGAKQTLMNVILSVVDMGDEVIIPGPFWVSYAAMVQLADGVAKILPSGIDTNFKISPAQLESAITPRTKMFLFSSPCNPSGTVYNYEELAAFADILGRYPDIVIVADEIYEHINFIGKHVSIGQFDAVKDRVVTVNGLSKGFAMTGWRLGYMGAPLYIANACNKMQGQFTSATCSITQRAAITALTGDMTPTHLMKEAFQHRRELVRKGLQDIPGLKVNDPEGAFYFFPDVSAFLGKSYNGQVINDADELSMYLLHTGHVSTVSGAPFFNPECIRLSYATSDEKLGIAIQRMKQALCALT